MTLSKGELPDDEMQGTDSGVRLIFGALLLVMLLASLDQTIVSTALPTIARDLGGLAQISWIVTAYMLAQTIVTPIWGKLGDLFGRKIVLQCAILLFLAGSALCGLSSSMGALIAFRAVQGLGGGGLMVSTMATISEIAPPRERARYQGYVGAVFAVSTVLGPLIGGLFVEQFNWHWIFYINLPLGLFATAVIGAVLASPEKAVSRPPIDVAGAVLMAAILTSLVLCVSLGGHAAAWASPGLRAMGGFAVMALPVFIGIERRAAEPVLPPWLFVNRTFVVASAVGFIVSFAMFGSITFLPVYLQVVKGVSPSMAGLELTPMMAGVLMTSIISGRMISRHGHLHLWPVGGTAVITLALALLSTLDVQSAAWAASLYALVLGLGIGMVMQVLLIAVQNSVDNAMLGVATAGVTLFRLIGGAVGVSVFGAIFANRLARGIASDMPRGFVLHGTTAALPTAIRQSYLAVFAQALHPVFMGAAATAALSFALSWLLGSASAKPHRKT